MGGVGTERKQGNKMRVTCCAGDRQPGRVEVGMEGSWEIHYFEFKNVI